MRDGAWRWPGAIPDDPHDDGSGVGVEVAAGSDTDCDGRPDTLLRTDGSDLLVLTDLDGDELADRVLRIGPDASVHAAFPEPLPPHARPHGAADDGPVTGHAPAAPGSWGTLLARLLGLDP